MRRIFIAGIAALALGGCVDVKQNLLVTNDDQATLVVELSVEAAILAMQKDDAQPFCQASDAPKTDGLIVNIERQTERGDVVCTITATGSLDRLAEVIQHNSLLPSSGDATAKATTTFVRDGENYGYEVTMPFDTSPPAAEGAPDTSKMMIAMAAGRSMSWSVTAPSIIETSGTLSEDGKTASYSVPLASLVSGEVPEARFSATFSTKSGNGLMDWMGDLFGQ